MLFLESGSRPEISRGLFYEDHFPGEWLATGLQSIEVNAGAQWMTATVSPVPLDFLQPWVNHSVNQRGDQLSLSVENLKRDVRLLRQRESDTRRRIERIWVVLK